MDNSIFCAPSVLDNQRYQDGGSIGADVFFADSDLTEADLEKFDVAILSCEEDRNDLHNQGTGENLHLVLDELYKLKQPFSAFRIADLGSIKKGEEVNDSHFALRSTIKGLIEKGKTVIVLGGSQHLTLANYQAYADLEKTVNLVAIDRSLDVGKYEDELSSSTYLSKIILSQPNYLFNFSNLGYQSYFVSQQDFELVQQLYFDAMRLGELRSDIREVEPVFRNANQVSFDLSSLKATDFSATGNPSPNGFHSEEACQLARYAGISDKVSSFGLYGYNHRFDKNGLGAQLTAQILWYFLEGFYQRKNDNPNPSDRYYLKYRVANDKEHEELVFYKSLRTDRWWMDLPSRGGNFLKFSEHKLLPCSYQDYLTACKNEIPEKWWKATQKMI